MVDGRLTVLISVIIMTICIMFKGSICKRSQQDSPSHFTLQTNRGSVILMMFVDGSSHSVQHMNLQLELIL